MNVVIPEEKLPMRLTPDPEAGISVDDFWDFCVANPDGRFELTAAGEIVIVPPPGIESDFQSNGVAAQLYVWAEQDERGQSFGASAHFKLPSGATYAPDAAWVSHRQLDRLTKDQKRKFAPVCPEFIVEVMSPSDRLNAAKKKMQEWMRGGVELAWLIHADKREVYIYRAGQTDPERRRGIDQLAGEGPVAGFELNLARIWQGL